MPLGDASGAGYAARREREIRPMAYACRVNPFAQSRSHWACRSAVARPPPCKEGFDKLSPNGGGGSARTVVEAQPELSW